MIPYAILFYFNGMWLFVGGPPTNNSLFVGGHPTNNSLFVGGHPTNNPLFVGGHPTNNSLFVGGLPMSRLLSIGGLFTHNAVIIIHQRSNGYTLSYRMETMAVLFEKLSLSLRKMSSVVFMFYSGLIWECV